MLRELREEKGLTAEKLGARVSVAGATVLGWEKFGHEPSYEILYKLAKFFSVTVGQLLGVEEY